MAARTIGATVLALAAVAAAEDSTCSASDSSCAGAGKDAAGAVTGTDPYYWPMAMGHPKYYSNPPWPSPTDLSSPSWIWFGPGKRYEEAFVGAVIDDKKNIYVIGDETAYKLNQNGQMLWSYAARAKSAAEGPVIYRGRMHGATTDGHVYAVDMETGQEIWRTKASSYDGMEYSGLAAHQGMLITRGDMKCMDRPFQACASEKVRGLNASNGQVLWTYQADEALWDWFPQFPDDESVIFMDKIGGLYKLRLHTGELLWKTRGIANSWTDGSQFVASNGLTYVVQVDWEVCEAPRKGYVFNCQGYVTAFRSSDGSRVWNTTVPKPPNTSPVLGRVGKDKKPTLIMPIGQQSQESCNIPGYWLFFYKLSFLPRWLSGYLWLPFHWLGLWLEDSNWLIWGSLTRTHDVVALDPETGERLWTWEGPTLHRKCNYGDEDGIVTRYSRGMRMVCCPTPWGQPRVDSEGTIFLANENGDVFALRDIDGDGKFEAEKKEVSVYHTKGTFPHCGTAHAPGLVVATNFDGVYAWKS